MASSPTQGTQRDVALYKTTWFKYAHKHYEQDLKKRQKAGWRLVSCTQTGQDAFRRPILTAIYER